MTTTAEDEREAEEIDLTRTEQWILHHVMLDRVFESEDPNVPGQPPPWWAIRVLEKLEAGTHRFTRYEGWRIVEALREYVGRERAPASDRARAADVLQRFDRTFDRPPMIDS